MNSMISEPILKRSPLRILLGSWEELDKTQPLEPNAEEEPEEFQEAQFGKTRSAIRKQALVKNPQTIVENQQAINKFIKKNYPDLKLRNSTPLILNTPEMTQLWSIVDSLRNLPFTDEITQKRIRGLLFNSLKEAPN